MVVWGLGVTSIRGESSRPSVQSILPIAALSALGIVFGDIDACLHSQDCPGTHRRKSRYCDYLGALSLVIWTLIVVTTIKYVSVAMRVDNDGEGGILALMALLA